MSSTFHAGCSGSAIWYLGSDTFREKIRFSIYCILTDKTIFKIEMLYISTEKKKDLYDPFFCISVLIVYIFIMRTDVGNCFFVFFYNIYPNFYYS